MIVKRYLLPLLLFAGLIISSACNPSRHIRPLEKGQVQVTGSFGGPLIGFAGTTIPVPLTSFGAGYGITDDLTAFGNLHTTALASGVIQTDLGASYKILSPNGWQPGISAQPILNLAIDTWEGNFKFWPQVDAHLYWEYSQKKTNHAYVGLGNWFELSGKGPHEGPQTVRWLPTINAGHVFQFNRWNLITEMKWIAPNVRNDNVVVEYKSFGDIGSVGVYVGAGFNICQKKEEGAQE